MIVVPFSAGGPADVVARTLAQSMSKFLDQQFIVENTVGAGSTLGAARVAGSPPDGYSISLTHISHVANVAPERARPDVLRAHLKSEIDKWVPIIKKAGVQAQ